MRKIVMASSAGALYILAATQAHAAASLVGALNLACTGQAEKIEYGADDHVRSQEGDVRLYLADTGGTAEIPRFIGGEKEGRQTVHLFTVSDAAITGKINYQAFGNAKMRIDRLAGTLAITGPKGNFSGRCQPFDPSSASPKF